MLPGGEQPADVAVARAGSSCYVGTVGLPSTSFWLTNTSGCAPVAAEGNRPCN